MNWTNGKTHTNMDELVNLDSLLRVLMDLARDIEDNYKEQLAASGRYTTEYNLIDSVRTEVRVADKGYEIVMHLKDYWKYVEEDTKPHFPPPSKILEWIQIKPIIPRPDKLGRIPTEDQLAFLIGRKIARVGTKGSHDLEKTKDAIIPFYRERIKEALGHDMESYIRKLMVEK